MRTIKKAKLNSVGYMEIEFDTVISDGNEKFSIESSQKCTWSPHNDLLVLLDELKPHLAYLCEQTEVGEIDLFAYVDIPHPILSKLKVTGFTIGGSDEHEGVTLIGRRQLAGNRVLNLVSPFTKWEDTHNGYQYSFKLASLIRKLQYEVELYLDGKKAPSVQMELEFEGESEKIQ